MNPSMVAGPEASPGSTEAEFASITGDAGGDLVRRRDFLRRVAGVIGGSALLTELPWLSPLSASPQAAPSDRVRLAIIGTGSRGNFLLDHLLRTPGVDIVALCDNYRPHLDRALAKVASTTGAYEDHRRLLEQPNVDGVLIATPLYQHAPVCLDALAADKHVFCEKSFGYTIDECRAMARAAAASSKVFQIGHQRLFSPPFLRAHELVSDGEIGDITQIRAYWHRNGDWRNPVPSPELERKLNWRLYREYSCGLMTELASHHVHVANWFLDAYPLSCVGYGSINYWKDGRELHDTVNVVFRYRDGVHLVYDSLISNRFHGLEIQVMGPKGTIEAESGKFYLENPPPAPAIVQLLNQLEQSVFETIPVGGPSWVPDLKTDTEGTWLSRNLKGDDGSALSLAAFAGAVRTGTRMPYMIDHAYRAGVAALMGQIAMEENREVAWPGDYRV
jgi:predicted dehydrogenase